MPSRPPVGPRALGLGGANVIFNDAWAIFNNPAGLTDIEEITALFAYRTIFDFSPFNTVSAGAVLPTPLGNVGFGVYRFGDDIFNSQMASLSFAKQTGIVRLGIKANYLQYNIEGFGRKGTFFSRYWRFGRPYTAAHFWSTGFQFYPIHDFVRYR
uniref:hypothetical protein n=1 Tax=Roseivirga sp. TaxID=1964215 RepID=UPI004048063E